MSLLDLGSGQGKDECGKEEVKGSRSVLDLLFIPIRSPLVEHVAMARWKGGPADGSCADWKATTPLLKLDMMHYLCV